MYIFNVHKWLTILLSWSVLIPIVFSIFSAWISETGWIVRKKPLAFLPPSSPLGTIQRVLPQYWVPAGFASLGSFKKKNFPYGRCPSRRPRKESLVSKKFRRLAIVFEDGAADMLDNGGGLNPHQLLSACFMRLLFFALQLSLKRLSPEMKSCSIAWFLCNFYMILGMNMNWFGRSRASTMLTSTVSSQLIWRLAALPCTLAILISRAFQRTVEVSTPFLMWRLAALPCTLAILVCRAFQWTVEVSTPFLIWRLAFWIKIFYFEGHEVDEGHGS